MRTRPSLPAVRTCVLLVATLLAMPGALHAQAPDTTSGADSLLGARGGRLFEVSVITGYQLFDKATALRSSPTFGLRITGPGFISRLPGLTFGASAAFARPTTRGDYFPWNRQIYFSDINRRNDTTLVYEVSQRVTMAHYAGEVGYRLGGAPRRTAAGIIPDLRSMTVEGTIGLGGYVFWEDPEQNRGNEVHSMGSWLFGGGIGIPLPRNTMLKLRADNVVLTSFDRDWFSLSDPLFREELFQPSGANPPALKSTVHNLRLSVQFSFVPGSER